jgi:hypothetical protein
VKSTGTEFILHFAFCILNSALLLPPAKKEHAEIAYISKGLSSIASERRRNQKENGIAMRTLAEKSSPPHPPVICTRAVAVQSPIPYARDQQLTICNHPFPFVSLCLRASVVNAPTSHLFSPKTPAIPAFPSNPTWLSLQKNNFHPSFPKNVDSSLAPFYPRPALKKTTRPVKHPKRLQALRFCAAT